MDTDKLIKKMPRCLTVVWLDTRAEADGARGDGSIVEYNGREDQTALMTDG